ncbi:MAG: DNA polymerase Y family protein [Corynebacterium sp.]|uniref:DNA polymerase Y family protein n=1 Tax=Corynebacterium sp. TaxID=1720 RepID=UPI0026DB20BC|nr:DNA polymerase Y family protein [Corynebacterium sp.]MDO4762623.1 DNA polymerase Y family protein [Corynebacterium sp.]
MRTLALWFPDWPAQASVLANLAQITDPIVIAEQHAVAVSNLAARKRGIRRGMRLRNVHALAPDAVVLSRDHERDGRMFSDIADSLDAVAAHIEIMRPGLVLIDAAAAGRYHGSEDIAAEKALDTVAFSGMDCSVGIADEIPTAIIAARCGKVVPPGQSAQFLATQPLNIFGVEPALGCEPALIDTLNQLGISTLGELKKLRRSDLATRFGAPGVHCHDIACGHNPRRIHLAQPTVDMSVRMIPEEPITRIDVAAFAARTLAVELHTTLRAHGYSCLRLTITARFGESEHQRTWRTHLPLDEQATADRVRWQLEGWLNAHNRAQSQADEPEGVTELILDPIECANPTAHTLWGNTDTQADIHRIISRIQSQVGVDNVLQPQRVGGRGVAERITYHPCGEQAEAPTPHSWPGALPAPLPTQLAHPASMCTLVGAQGQAVTITRDAVFSTAPAGLQWGTKRYLIHSWAGPWPVLREWWLGEKPCARIQIVGVDTHNNPQAFLLLWVEGRWRVEATY